MTDGAPKKTTAETDNALHIASPGHPNNSPDGPNNELNIERLETRHLATTAGTPETKIELNMEDLQAQFEALPEADRSYQDQIRSWTQLVAAIPDTQAFLTALNSLDQPQLGFINDAGELVASDGGLIRTETFNQTYPEARIAARNISANSTRGLLTDDEYTRINGSRPPDQKFETYRGIHDRPAVQTWIESGENPGERARLGSWSEKRGNVSIGPPYQSIERSPRIGARYGLKLKLNW